MTDKCKKCGGTDFNPSGDCRPCRKEANAAYRAAHAGKKGKAVKTKKVKAPKAVKVKAVELELAVDACFGFTASITDEGYLQVQQHGQDGALSDTLVLSRPEFRQLVEKFSRWAAA